MMDIILTGIAVLAVLAVGFLWHSLEQVSREEVVKNVRVALIMTVLFLLMFIYRFWNYIFLWWLVKG